MVPVRSLGMAEVANGGHITVRFRTVLDSAELTCISVEATAKGLIAYRSLES